MKRKTNFVKRISLALCLVMLLTMAPMTATSADTPSSWALTEVTEGIALKLVPASLQSSYTQATTRAEFCALAVALYEVVMGKEITDRLNFDDTNDVNVEKAAAIKVVNGVGDNKFDPTAKLTREQAATMLSRLADAVGKPLTKTAAAFADNSSIAAWAIEGVGQVQAAGIMAGVGSNTFAPKDPYTREQSILTIVRTHKVVESGTGGEEVPNISDIPPAEPEPAEASKPIDHLKLFMIEGGPLIFKFKPIPDLSIPLELEPEPATPPPATAPKGASDLVGISNISQKAPKITWKNNADNAEYIYLIRTEIVNNYYDAVVELPKISKDATEYIDNDAKPGKRYSYSVYTGNVAGKRSHVGACAQVRVYKAGEGNVTSSDTTVSKGLSYFGCGYDAFGEYAVPDTNKGLKANVLDYNKMVEWRQIQSSKKDPNNIDKVIENIHKTAYDYCRERTTSVGISGSFAGFSASVDTNFGSMNSQSNNKYVATQTRWVRLYEYKLAAPLDFDWSNFLLPSAQAAINNTIPGKNITPTELFATYGTHVMTSIWVGGKMDYNCSIESQSSESFTSFKINAKASYSGLFTASGYVDDETKERVKSFNSRTNRNVVFYGGTAGAGQMMFDCNAAALAMDKWRVSLDSSPTFTDFGSQRLIPIWELCSNQVRSNEIKKAFDDKASTKVGIFPVQKYITEFGTVYDLTKVPEGWSTVGTAINLNEKGTKPIYLVYRIGEDVNWAYTDIFGMLKPTAAQCAATFEKPWYVNHKGNYAGFYRRTDELNYGAPNAGYMKVLFGTRAKTPGKSPIKRIEVLRDPDHFALANAPDAKDWKWVYWLNSDEAVETNYGIGNVGRVHIRYMCEE